MEIMRSVAERLAGRFQDREPRRLAASLPRRRRSMRPLAEGLEVRSLLAVGLDPSFGFGGAVQLILPSTETNRVSFSESNIALQNGQVVAVGTETTDIYSSSGVFQSSTSSLAVARLNTDGSLDTTFGTNGVATIPAPTGTTYSPTDIGVQSNGQIVVLATNFTANNSLVVARLNANGSLDTSFGTAGIASIIFSSGGTPQSADADALAIGADGKIVAVATVFASTADEFGVARLNTNGTLDTTFNTVGTQEVPFSLGGVPANANAVDVAVQPTTLGIVVVGSVSPTSGATTSAIGVALLNPTGAFGASTLPSYTSTNDDSASAVTLQGTQIVIAGTSVVQSGSGNAIEIDELTVTRLNPNGTFDTTFNGTGKYTLTLNVGGIPYTTQGDDVTVMPDGSLLAGGSGSPYYSSGGGVLVNLTSAGTLNTSYGSNGVAMLPETAERRLLVQSDSKVVFADGSSIYRTTAPVPLTFPAPTLITTGIGTKTKVAGVTVFFNTAVNPAMASNITIYQVRVGTKGKSFIKIKRATYNSSNNSVTLQFRSSAKLNKKGYQVLIMGSTGIVESGAEILNNGALLTVNVAPIATA